MKIFFFTLVVFVLTAFIHKSDKPAYKIFGKDGKESNYEAMLKSLEDADIVLVGELHNNPICHWLELEILKDLHTVKKNNLLLGAEMFESDNQLLLDEYLKQTINAKQLEEEGKMWNNFKTDYKPLLDFAQKNQLPCIATNVPRRYASLVSKKGMEALNDLAPEAKQWFAPLPIEVDLAMRAYKNMIEMMAGHGGEMKPENFAKAQALKDATMAYFILKNWEKGKTFVHYNGSYHSDNYESIVWYLKSKNKDLKIKTVSSVEQADLKLLQEDSKGVADFIIVIPESMTKTY